MEAAVFGHLHAACFSNSAIEQETALRTLKEIEDGQAQNLYSLITALASVISGAAPAEVRLLAVICLKNMALKSWMKLDDACKGAMWQFVRSALENLESNPLVAMQTAVLTAKMCRREWPSTLVTNQLFPFLFSLLRDSSNWRRQTQTLKAIDEILVPSSPLITPHVSFMMVS